jgi:hypothetical protein
MKSFVREYTSAASCKHAGSLRLLGNREMACEDCVHVAIRRDGERVKYAAPNALRLMATLMNETVPYSPEEEV